MDQNVFVNATDYSYSPIYQIDGKLIVSIDGVLDGADVITYHCKGVPENPEIIEPCSWKSSSGTTFSGSDSKYELIPNHYIFFVIINTGELTNINLKFRVEPFQQTEDIWNV